MNILSVNGLSKSFGARVLFKNISFGIARGEKVALIARNGSGKTTLFRILKGQEIADEGEIAFRKDIRTAFLDQDFSLNETLTISESMMRADNPCVAAIREYSEAVDAVTAHVPGSDDRLEKAMERMSAVEGWDYEKRLHEILAKLGIRDMNLQIASLSGGQKKRVALAVALLDAPDLLVLDEPTNHLDLDMTEWLAHYLRTSNMTVLLVTHDRYFLDAVCDRILELDAQSLYSYDGDYAYFIQKKDERESALSATIDKARNLYRRELEWVRRMPKARGTKAKARLDAFEDIKATAFQKRGQGQVQISVKTERLGSKILELHKITKSYPGKVILKPFTYTFIKGEKIGIVGPNGAGKSTLLNIVQGITPPDSGKVVAGDTVVFGYYSQKGIQLANDARIIEVVRAIAEYIPLADGTTLSASQLLTRFNFPPAVQYSMVSTLSGGEKRRLYLLTVLVKNPNFLILDEPTNDLDIATLQVLEDFLASFSGCVLIVSHDRYFLDKLVDHLFVFEGEGEIRDFPGNYTEYRDWQDEREAAKKQSTINAPAKSTGETAGAASKKDASKLSYKERLELETLEKAIAALEAEKVKLEHEMSEGTITAYDELNKRSERLLKLGSELDDAMMRWMELEEKKG